MAQSSLRVVLVVMIISSSVALSSCSTLTECISALIFGVSLFLALLFMFCMSLALIVVTCVSLSVGFVVSDEGDDDNEDEVVKGFEQ